MSIYDLALAALEMEPRGRVPWTCEQAIERAKARIALRVARARKPVILRMVACRDCGRTGYHHASCAQWVA